jgi:hypothetical protein
MAFSASSLHSAPPGKAFTSAVCRARPDPQLAASKLFYGLNKSTRAVAHVFLQIWVAERLLNVRLPGPLWAVTTVRCQPLISDADRGRDRECGGA